VAKSNRTNRDRPTDDSADIQPDGSGADAADLPVDDAADDTETSTDGAPSQADGDAQAGDGADGEKTPKSAATPAAKPPARNRKAAKDSAKSGKKNAARSGNPAKRAANRKTASYTSTPGTQTIKPNGRWFVPTMVTILLLGLAWLVVFYISSGAYPVEAWGYWNLGVGFAILVAGLVMSTRWR